MFANCTQHGFTTLFMQNATLLKWSSQ